MSDEKCCFIIMPITTPESMREKYRDGKDHFRHVLDCLFIPSIKKAGYEPIPPIAKGSDLIHAEIIKNLETADLVLCDMSSLNPNVFFEFGIRTSLNRAVSVVKDEHTDNVPFDTGILNYHEYQSSLDPWILESEIGNLTKHLTTSAERSNGENTLWRYFGIKSEATPYQAETGADAKLEYLSLQMEGLGKKIDILEKIQRLDKSRVSVKEPTYIEKISDFIASRMPSGAEVETIAFDEPNLLTINHKEQIDPFTKDLIKRQLLGIFGLYAHFVRSGTLPEAE